MWWSTWMPTGKYSYMSVGNVDPFTVGRTRRRQSMWWSTWMPTGKYQGWALVLFKRTQRSCILFRSLEKNEAFFAFFPVLYKRTEHFFRSFPFFIFIFIFIFAFFSILYKRTERSLCSFPFFIKEQNDLCALFSFISHTKKANLA